ncbi:A disintegrin and metalloproteinase with thrombospondin motifs 18 [Galemys pyrenaicus]|uniref:A disintegrin and metalloproteinase with thrombospondin motifs 18 n=1 Tax=Galemys pyrenaicus TaxID=202257 RepID=A0A8J6AK15_GALPY|nr:A disintegrin and metalloproteinase with thrombospondin motifs 18 [Galemys pyrenaicus]
MMQRNRGVVKLGFSSHEAIPKSFRLGRSGATSGHAAGLDKPWGSSLRGCPRLPARAKNLTPLHQPGGSNGLRSRWSPITVRWRGGRSAPARWGSQLALLSPGASDALSNTDAQTGWRAGGQARTEPPQPFALGGARKPRLGSLPDSPGIRRQQLRRPAPADGRARRRREEGRRRRAPSRRCESRGSHLAPHLEYRTLGRRGECPRPERSARCVRPPAAAAPAPDHGALQLCCLCCASVSAALASDSSSGGSGLNDGSYSVPIPIPIRIPRRVFPDYVFVTPVEVDSDGSYVSHDIFHQHGRKRRWVQSASSSLHYRFSAFGQELHLELQPSAILSSHFIVQVLGKDGASETQAPEVQRCFYQGFIRNDSSSSVAVSTCAGLTIPKEINLMDAIRFVKS